MGAPKWTPNISWSFLQGGSQQGRLICGSPQIDLKMMLVLTWALTLHCLGPWLHQGDVAIFFGAASSRRPKPKGFSYSFWLPERSIAPKFRAFCLYYSVVISRIMYIYKQIQIKNTHTYLYIYIHVCIYSYVHIHMCVYIYTHMYMILLIPCCQSFSGSLLGEPRKPWAAPRSPYLNYGSVCNGINYGGFISTPN